MLGKRRMNVKTLPDEIQNEIKGILKPFDEKMQKLHDARTDYDNAYSLHYYVDKDQHTARLYIRIELRFIENHNFTDEYEIIGGCRKYLETGELLQTAYRFIDHYICYYCGQTFEFTSYYDHEKSLESSSEFMKAKHLHEAKCPKKPRCHTCCYTDEKCREICERCGKEHYYCECRTVAFVERTDPSGNKLEVPS